MARHLIFTFGSNEAGRHGAGAARHAHDSCDAKLGVGFGLTGRSFAIPTKDASIRRSLTIKEIGRYVDEFIRFATAHPELYFQVTPIGCGLAGHKQEDIKPLFRDMPDNCFFSAEWTI